MYKGKSSDISKIKTHLKKNNNIIKQQGDSLIIFTKEETRLVRKGEFITISLSGKLM